MIFVGIDPSLTCTSLCTVWLLPNSGDLRFSYYSIKRKNKLGRFPTLQAIFEQTMRELSLARETSLPVIAAVEGYAFAAPHSRSITQLAEVGGVVRLAAWMSGAVVVEVPAPTWKATMCGNGHASKEDAAACAVKLHRYKAEAGSTGPVGQDQCDATHIALFAFLAANSGNFKIMEPFISLRNKQSVVEMNNKIKEALLQRGQV